MAAGSKNRLWTGKDRDELTTQMGGKIGSSRVLTRTGNIWVCGQRVVLWSEQTDGAVVRAQKPTNGKKRDVVLLATPGNHTSSKRNVFCQSRELFIRKNGMCFAENRNHFSSKGSVL